MATSVRPTPAAPVEAGVESPVTQEGRWGVDEALSSIAQSAIAQTIAETTPPAETPTRDEKGRFVKADAGTDPAAAGAPTTDPAVVDEASKAGDAGGDVGAAGVAAGQPDADTETPEPGTEPVTLPDGMVAVPAISREPATQFKVLDGDGELEPPDLMIEFNANGKTRKEPLDKVVKLAQFGVYNEERQQQIVQVQQQAQAIEQRNQQLTQALQQMLGEREQLLSNDDAYLLARAQHEQQNTPEARAQRVQQQTSHAQQQLQFEQAAFQGQQFLASELEPAVSQIAKALPSVTDEEIGAKLLLVTDRFRVHTPFGSLIPPAAYPQVRQAIVTDVVPWAQQLHEHRQSERQSAAQAASATVEQQRHAAQAAADAARVEAQRAKNLVGRVAKPAATSARTPGDNAPPPRPIRTVDDAANAAIADAVAAAMGG